MAQVQIEEFLKAVTTRSRENKSIGKTNVYHGSKSSVKLDTAVIRERRKNPLNKRIVLRALILQGPPYVIFLTHS